MANACATVKTLLDGAWLIANTDGKKPFIVNTQDETDENNSSRSRNSMQDYIRIYEEAPGKRKASGIGNLGMETENHLTVDINVETTELHANKVLQETLRILEVNHNSPGTGFDYIEPEKDIQNFSGTRYQKMWRWAVSITLLKTNTSLGT